MTHHTDPRIAAIRSDSKIGNSTCSVIAECYDDSDLIRVMDAEQITDPAKAVKHFRRMASFWQDHADDIAATAF